MLDAFGRLSDPLAAIWLTVNATKCRLWCNGTRDVASDPGVPLQIIELSPSPQLCSAFFVAGNSEALSSFAREEVDKATKAISPYLQTLPRSGWGSNITAFQLDQQDAKFVALCFRLAYHAVSVLGRPHEVKKLWANCWSLLAYGLGTNGFFAAFFWPPRVRFAGGLGQAGPFKNALSSVKQIVQKAAECDGKEGRDSGSVLGLWKSAQSRQQLPPEPHLQFWLPIRSTYLSGFWSHRTGLLMRLITCWPIRALIIEWATRSFEISFECGSVTQPLTGHADCTSSLREDPQGLKRLGCKAAGDARLCRHDGLADVVAKVALAAVSRAFRVAREKNLPDAGCRVQPGDIALNLGSGRKLLDVTVVNPFSAAVFGVTPWWFAGCRCGDGLRHEGRQVFGVVWGTRLLLLSFRFLSRRWGFGSSPPFVGSAVFRSLRGSYGRVDEYSVQLVNDAAVRLFVASQLTHATR